MQCPQHLGKHTGLRLAGGTQPVSEPSRPSCDTLQVNCSLFCFQRSDGLFNLLQIIGILTQIITDCMSLMPL